MSGSVSTKTAWPISAVTTWIRLDRQGNEKGYVEIWQAKLIPRFTDLATERDRSQFSAIVWERSVRVHVCVVTTVLESFWLAHHARITGATGGEGG